jgi:hypothetical protein
VMSARIRSGLFFWDADNSMSHSGGAPWSMAADCQFVTIAFSFGQFSEPKQ